MKKIIMNSFYLVSLFACSIMLSSSTDKVVSSIDKTCAFKLDPDKTLIPTKTQFGNGRLKLGSLPEDTFRLTLLNPEDDYAAIQGMITIPTTLKYTATEEGLESANVLIQGFNIIRQRIVQYPYEYKYGLKDVNGKTVLELNFDRINLIKELTFIHPDFESEVNDKTTKHLAIKFSKYHMDPINRRPDPIDVYVFFISKESTNYLVVANVNTGEFRFYEIGQASSN